MTDRADVPEAIHTSARTVSRERKGMVKRTLTERTWLDAEGEETTDPEKGLHLLGPAGREITDGALSKLKQSLQSQAAQSPKGKAEAQAALAAAKKKQQAAANKETAAEGDKSAKSKKEVKKS